MNGLDSDFEVSGAKFVVLFLLFASCESEVVHETPNSSTTNATGFHRKWITELFREAEINFHIASTASTKCKQDFATYREHLQNQSEWAVRMTESSEWPVVGFLAGTMNHLGNWAECSSATSQKDISGQYCLVSANYQLTKMFLDDQDALRSENAESSAWNLLQEFGKQPWKYNRQVVNWALCVPNSCQADDVRISLQKILRPIFQRQNLDISVTVDPSSCSKEFKENWWKDSEMGNTLFWIFTKCVIALIVLSTIYHAFTNNEEETDKKSLGHEIMTSFSVVRNYKDLTRVTPEDIPCLYLGKILFMVFAVQAHRICIYYSFPVYNSEAIEKDLYTEGSNLIEGFHFGSIVLEPFFMYSGFFLFTAHLAKTKVKGWFAVVEDLLHRWAKMIPLHMYMLIILTYVMPTLADGPIWYRTIVETERCKSSLWPNFFAVSNIFGPEKMCLFHSWFTSMDIQLTFIGSIILVLYTKNEKLGTYITILVFAGGTAFNFIHTYTNKYHGILYLFVNNLLLRTSRNSEEFLNSYISIRTRISSYMVGFAFGIVSQKLAEKKFKFTEESIFIMIIINVCSKVAIVKYLPQLCEFAKPYNLLENAISAAILRTLFVLPEAVGSCAYAGTRKFKYAPFFDSNVWVPIGRLLYGIYIVNVVLQFYHSASHQVLVPSDSYSNILWLLVGDLIYSTLGAFILFLMIQAPIFNLLKICIRQLMRKQLIHFKAVKLPKNETKQFSNELKHDKKL